MLSLLHKQRAGRELLRDFGQALARQHHGDHRHGDIAFAAAARDPESDVTDRAHFLDSNNTIAGDGECREEPGRQKSALTENAHDAHPVFQFQSPNEKTFYWSGLFREIHIAATGADRYFGTGYLGAPSPLSVRLQHARHLAGKRTSKDISLPGPPHHSEERGSASREHPLNSLRAEIFHDQARR
jgi:hypothetical protein